MASATHQVAAADPANAIVDDAAAQASSSVIPSFGEELKRAAEKVKFDSSNIEAKVHRYPAIFRGLMSQDNRYFVPRCVAIGPYHHRAAHVQRAEEIKRAAAYFICNKSGHSVDVIYAKILTVAGDARRCCDHDDVAGIPQTDFATMMFQDGCFLLHYILWRTATRRHWQYLSPWFAANIESIQRDIFLLENQVPWLVLDALMAFMPAPVGEFISRLARSFDTRHVYRGNVSSPFVWDESFKPVHLLDLLRYYQSGFSVPRESRSLILTGGITSVPQSSSAIDLAEIGIQLTQNSTAKFRDMGVEKGLFCFCNRLFLAPLVMDDLNACWLLNMVAFERSIAKGSSVRTYVLLIAMLMNREEDVHELRVKRILHGKFSDQRTLSFFKDLAELISLTREYQLILAQVEAYRRKYWIWILLHKFIYNNFKYIVMVFSIIGVLVGIFKALFSIKQG